jgi:hypothetical protein
MKIEEYDNDTHELDTTLFLFYDRMYSKYILRGKRNDTTRHLFAPYSFECDNANKLYNFLKILFGLQNYLSITMYNYDNLAYDSNDIYYDCLKNNESEKYEIVAYDEVEIENTMIYPMIQSLKTIQNYFSV